MIDLFCYSDSGGAEINEDSFGCGKNVFVVADGLGGHSRGEAAAQAAVKYILDSCGENADISDKALLALIENVNRHIRSMQTGKTDLRTTIAAVFVNGRALRFLNVGDSRVYYFKKDAIFTVSKDHSVSQAAVDMGQIKQADIRFHDDRCKLLKAVGDSEDLRIRKTYPPIEIEDGDAFLICSDGFWEYIFEEEMEIDLLKANSAEEWLRAMLRRHIAKAKNKGDNYTAVCGMFIKGWSD